MQCSCPYADYIQSYCFVYCRIMSIRATSYSHEWEKIGNNSKWLQPYTGDITSAYCSACNTKISVGSMGYTAVKSHAKGKVHEKHVQSIAGSTRLNFPTLSTSESTPTSSSASASKIEASSGALRAEAMFVIFMAEHNIPFIAADHSGVLKQMFPDSAIAKDMSLKRTKSTYLMTHGVRPFGD